MNKKVILSGLNSYRERLRGEVVSAFEQKGTTFGNDRFNTWRRKITQFLNEYLPGESSTLDAKLTHLSFLVKDRESSAECFWREDGGNMDSYIESLIMDIENDEYDFPETDDSTKPSIIKDLNSVFIVHGHDNEAKERTARFIEKLGFNAVILHEQVNRGKTIIEKIEKYSNVGFAIVLYTPDDLGNKKSEAKDGKLISRARQNVIFEHGYLMGKIGRENVLPLVVGTIELPNDISGMVYISDKDWQVDIAKEMKDVGYEIDFNKLL